MTNQTDLTLVEWDWSEFENAETAVEERQRLLEPLRKQNFASLTRKQKKALLKMPEPNFARPKQAKRRVSPEVKRIMDRIH